MNRTQRFPVNQVILEGPDLAGKTTFYNELHRLSGYKWNIQDRSALSMLVHAKLYNRDLFVEVERLNKELKDLNNVYVILLPPWNEVARRFNERGDEIQNLASLRKLYGLFAEAANDLESFPNVIVIRSNDTKSWAEQTVKSIVELEITPITLLHEHVCRFSRASKNFDANHINLTYYDDGSFKHINKSVLDYKPEKKYYAGIMTQMLGKIEKELTGKNEYNRKEDITSRRFVYTNESCISFIQYTFRNDMLDCHFVLRSSNTKDTLKYDLQFLYYLTSRAYEMLKIEKKRVRMRVNFNSAHIIINEKGVL